MSDVLICHKWETAASATHSGGASNQPKVQALAWQEVFLSSESVTTGDGSSKQALKPREEVTRQQEVQVPTSNASDGNSAVGREQVRRMRWSVQKGAGLRGWGGDKLVNVWKKEKWDVLFCSFLFSFFWPRGKWEDAVALIDSRFNSEIISDNSICHLIATWLESLSRRSRDLITTWQRWSTKPRGGTEFALSRVAPGEICNLNPTKIISQKRKQINEWLSGISFVSPSAGSEGINICNRITAESKTKAALRAVVRSK